MNWKEISTAGKVGQEMSARPGTAETDILLLREGAVPEILVLQEMLPEILTGEETMAIEKAVTIKKGEVPIPKEIQAHLYGLQ